MAEDTGVGDVENPTTPSPPDTATTTTGGSGNNKAHVVDPKRKWKLLTLATFLVVAVVLAIVLGIPGRGGGDPDASTTDPSTPDGKGSSEGCLVGDIMYSEGDSTGHIGLECVNSTSYDASASTCGAGGEIVETEVQLACPESSPYCVQCGPRGWGAALCLSTETTDRPGCGDGDGDGESTTTATTTAPTTTGGGIVAEPQLYEARYLAQNGPIQARVRIIDPTVADGYGSCDELREDIENALGHYANSIIVREKNYDWYEKCDPLNPNQPYLYGYEDDDSVGIAEVEIGASMADSAGSFATPDAKVPGEDSFGTNNQVDGVDEADIAKSDGDYVYAAYGDLLYVWNATDGTQGISVTKMPFNDTTDDENCGGLHPGRPFDDDVVFEWSDEEEVDVSDVSKPSSAGGAAGSAETVSSPPDVPAFAEGSEASSAEVTAGSAQETPAESPAGIRNRRDRLRRKALSIAPGWNPCRKSKPRILSLLLDPEALRLTAIVSEANPNGWYFDYEDDNSEPDPIINDSNQLFIRVYDVSNVPTDGSPLTLLAEKEIKGNYDSARSVGSTGFVITTSYVDKYSFSGDLFRYQPEYCGLNSDEYEKLATEKALENMQPFIERMVDEMQLHFDGTCSGIFRVSAMQSGDTDEDSTDGDMLGQFVQVSSFDMSSDYENTEEITTNVGAAETTTNVGAAEITTNVGAAFSSGWLNSVYASQDFAATLTVGSSYNEDSGDWDQSTFILGFDMRGTKPEPFCYAEIGGQPLNQYSTDLHKGHLRVVTTEWNWSNTESRTTNKIFVLKVPEANEGQVMQRVGETNKPLGKENESVFAVRFIGDMAYIVTFEQTDPFYIYDLSNPHNPKMMGELEIPGYSSYLHPVNFDGLSLMLGVGEDVNATSGRRVGVKISLFDISDPKNPTESATFVDEGAWSSAGHDFKAFRFLPQSRKLILPKSEYTWSDEGNFDGFVVYDVSMDKIAPAFEIQHASSHSMYNGCWYSAFMPARSFVFNSKLTTILSHSVMSTDLQNGDELWNVTLGENMTKDDDCSPYFLSW